MKKNTSVKKITYLFSSVFYFAVFLTAFYFPNLVEAKGVVISTVTPSLVNSAGDSFYKDKPPICNNLIGKNKILMGKYCDGIWPKRFFYYDGLSGFFYLNLYSSYAQAEYYADLVNSSNNDSPISDESYISVGSSFSVNGYLGSVVWVSSGGVNDTPIGHWTNGASPPSNLGYKCSGNDYVFSSQLARVYAPFSVNPPAVSYNQSETTATLSCSPNGSQCTALSSGKVSLNVNFSETYGFIYPQYSLYENLGLITAGECLYSLNPLSPRINLPATSITFNFNVGSPPPENQKPSISIEAPAEAFVGDDVLISFIATDDDSDKVKVAIDGDSSGEVSQWLPSSNNYVSSGEKQNTTRSWSEKGRKTFKAKAVDEHGAESGWVSDSIEIKERCDNGQIDTGEVCDGTNLGGQSCSTLNNSYFTGTISCNNTCSGFIQNCTNNTNNPNYCPTEGGTRSCSTGLSGICSSGQKTCTGNTWGACLQLFSSGNEICDNGLDDDCDGQVDENCSVNPPPPVTPICNNNNVCNRGENFSNCPKDCPATIIETRAPKPSFMAWVLGVFGR